IFIVPRHAAPPGQAVPASDPTAPAARTSRPLVLLAWVANAVAYGVSSTFHVHAPELLVERGENAFDFGAFLGIVFAVQAISFAPLARRIPNFRDPVLA